MANFDRFDAVKQVGETEEIKEAGEDIDLIKVGVVEDGDEPEEVQKIPVDLDTLA
jgi:hypothetical protein